MTSSRLKVAITGPFTDINFGDYAMVVNNIYDLAIKDLLLFSYDSDFIKLLKKDYLSDYNITLAETTLNTGLKEYFTERKNLVPFEILQFVENIDEITDKLSKIDILLVNGGGYFNDLWSLPHRIERLAQIIAPILIADKLGKKIVFTGNGFGPFENSSEFFSSIFGSLKEVQFSCRDNLYSPIWLRQLGICNNQIDFIPDDLLVINNDLNSMPCSLPITSNDYIVLETYLPQDYINQNKEHFIDFSKQLYEKYGLNIVFLPFHIENGGVNQGKLLASFLSNFELIDISDKGYLPIQDAINIIKRARLVISNRYHAVVLASSLATPTFSVLKDVLDDKRYYYNKNRGVLEQVLKGVYIDEACYFGLDYLDSLDYISHNFEKIISHQNKNYELVHSQNMQTATKIRNNFINNI